MAEGVRVQKVLADAGVASRRAAEVLIAAGRVAVNGVPATIGQRVDPARDVLTVDGRKVGAEPAPVYLALCKPAGVTSTVSDRHAARTVVELVPSDLRREAARLYPVGRLDRDSEGLILLTNDGDWAQRLLHPRHAVEREYAVAVESPLTADQLRTLARGIEVEEGLARIEGLRRLADGQVRELLRAVGGGGEPLTWYRAVLRQGWKRQLRRMFSAVGARVERLVRVRFGSVTLDGLQRGAVRRLSADEAADLSGSRPRLVVAIDGPGGSGKSSVGAGVAQRLGYRFCDTGVLYRGLTWLALERGVDPDDTPSLMALVRHIELAPDDQQRYVRLLADGHDVTGQLHTADVDREVSRVSRHAPVRASLLPIQRALAAPGGIIMAGRDIGTVVLPDADLKVYLDVSLEERARRRAQERGVVAGSPEFEAILAELRRRDGIDTTRETAPLRIPDDAVVVNTEGNTLEQTIERVVEIIEEAADDGAR